MAAAVVDLYPGAKYDVGPPIEDGFFYNFRLPDARHFSESDLGEAADQTAEKRKDQPKLHKGLTRVTAKSTKETIDGDQHESRFIEEQIQVKYEPDACPPRSTGRSRARIPVVLRAGAGSGSSDQPRS